MKDNEKLKLQSHDWVADNQHAFTEFVKAKFPNCITEGRVDMDLLRQEVSSEIVEGPKERYRLEWAGKREAIVAANKPTNATLRPIRSENGKEVSVNFDTTENLYIEGDNLEVLKLLQESYLGKIKMIYIDPPYNTGKEFVYKDKFSIDDKTRMIQEGLIDDAGNIVVGETNGQENNRYHSDWLSMMYPRLKIARTLLSDDGIIFISIDENEVANLKKMCDDIFGEANFLNSFVWLNKPEGRQISGVGAAMTHEYILVYSKDTLNASIFELSSNWLQKIMPASYNCKKSNVKQDDKGPYIITHELHNGNSKFNEETRPTLVFDIYYREFDGDIIVDNLSTDHLHEGYVKISPHVNADGIHKYHAYRWSKEKILKEKDNLEFVKSGNSYKIFTKRRNFDYTTVKDIITDLYTTQGSRDMKSLDIKGFDYPKPVELLRLLIKMATTDLEEGEEETIDSSIILDFFSGSATTAHAVMQLNAEDGGNRKFIMVQLPEKIDESKEAYKAGYKNICEIGEERIRRAAKKIQEENPEGAKGKDMGFRVFRLDSSNMKEVKVSPDDLKQTELDWEAANNVIDNIKEGRTGEDLLFQVMLAWGLPLSLPVAEGEIEGKKIYRVEADGVLILLCCFENGVDEAFAEAVAKQMPMRVLFRDSSFSDDNAKENVRQLLKQLSPNTEMRVL